MIDLRRGSGVRAGAFVYDGPAISTDWHAHEFHQLEYATRGALGVASRRVACGAFCVPAASSDLDFGRHSAPIATRSCAHCLGLL
jgi:hypothetical protein